MVGKNTKYYCFVAQERVNVGRNVWGLFLTNALNASLMTGTSMCVT